LVVARAGRVLFLGLAITILSIIAGCVRPAPVVTPSGPILLTVVTWNLHGARGDLPRLLDDLAAGRLTDAPVRDFVVLLQEATDQGDRDVRAIAASRQLSAFFSLVWRSPSRTNGNAILSTVPLINPRAIDLPRERQPRAAAIAAIPIAGETMFVVSTHLENRLGWLRGLFGDRARGRQAEALLLEVPPRQHGILGGDMNTMLGPTEPAWRAFLDRFPETPPRPAPTFRDRLVLDHLFFDLPDGWTATRRVIEDRYGSDHHPVLGVIHGS
jgi:endonuclease/exonuclease/phosphatase family metal-dependent hydrolase